MTAMIQISEIDLLCGCDIPLDGICMLKQPKLRALTSSGIGFSTYKQYLSLFRLSVADVLELTGLSELSELYAQLSEHEKKLVPVFDVVALIPDVRELLCEALAFFISGEISYRPETKSFTTSCGNFTGEITSENFLDVCDAIMQISCIASKRKDAPVSFRSEKAKRIFEKIEAAKQKMKQSAPDKAMEIPNVISAVAAMGMGYTLSNIWDLTVYQLYDLFARLNVKTQMDVYSTRWAAYGKDPFDFSMWYKPIEN